ncbi:DUF1467 family protein [Amorphus coralli]|uniref:DUF1467 family protein n=1 Tax=Amorphus coralli TaxID=340680 RepID=UPI0003766766|nr:DUF1467 family protein [Amorphus coralli]
MSLTSTIAVYFIVWWLIFFFTLPWGNRSQEEAGDEMTPGTMPSAPARPRLILKGAIAAVVAVGVMVAINAVVTSDLTLDDLPLPNPLEHTVEGQG